MSEENNTASPAAQSDLQTAQTAQVCPGPSGAEDASASDRPNENNPAETSLPAGLYPDLKLPEELNGCEENFASFKKLASELKLPAQAAKKLVEWESKAAADGRQNAQYARAQILQRWTEQTRQLFGPGYQQEVARALAAAERFGGPELRALLDATGLGSHPAVVKTFHQISQQIAEDTSVSGRVRAAADKTFAEALYGKAQ